MKLSAFAIIAALAFLASRSSARRMSNKLNTILQANFNNSMRMGMNMSMKGPNLPTPQLCYEDLRLSGSQKTTMPNLLPDHESCRTSAPKDFLRHWIVCPSRSRQWKACSYYCPGSGETTMDLPVEDGCVMARGLEPTPGRCNDPIRGDGAHLTPAYLPFKPRARYTDAFESVDSCKQLDVCVGKNTANCQNRNWIRCPSRSREFTECSYHCPNDLEKTTWTTVPAGPSGKDNLDCIIDAPPAPKQVGTFFKKTISQGVCMQVDIMSWGGILGLNFALGADVSLISPAHGRYSELTIEGFVGGGMTIGLILIQGSVYVEGHLSATLRIPPLINGVWRALHYAMSLLFDVVKKQTKLGRVIARWQEKRAAAKQDDKIAKIVELHTTIWNQAGYIEQAPVHATPYYCRMTARKNHKIIPSSIKISDTSCQRSASDIGANWIRCPKIGAEATKCDYFCPMLRKTVKTKPETKSLACPRHTVSDTAGQQVPAAGTALTVGKALRTDARLLLNMFLKKVYEKAEILMGFLQKNPPESEKYANEIEKTFRWAYFKRGVGPEPDVCHGTFCWPSNTVDAYGKMDCKKLAELHPGVSIGPMMCEIVQQGFLMGSGAGSNGNTNLREMLFALFPRILPRTGGSGALDKPEALKFVAAAMQADYNEMDSTIAFVSGITGLFSYPPDQILLVLKGMTQANTDFDEQNKANANYYDPECEEGKCSFGFKEIRFTTVFGITVGGSRVGFCTPDTNTFQVQRTRTGTLARGGKIGVHIEWENPKWTGTIALGIYVAGAITFEVGTRTALAGLQFRFRLPLEFGENVNRDGVPTKADEATYKLTLESIGQWLTDNQGGWAKGLVETRTSDFFAAALKTLTTNIGDGFLGAIGKKLGSSMAKGVGETMVKWLAEKVFKLGKAGIDFDLSYKRSNLIGFDVTYEKNGAARSVSFALVQHRYSEVSTTIPLNPGISLSILGYEGTELQFEGTKYMLKN